MPHWNPYEPKGDPFLRAHGISLIALFVAIIALLKAGA